MALEPTETVDRTFTCLYYYGITTEYANVSVKFPEELDRELEQFLEETGVYTTTWTSFVSVSTIRRSPTQM